MSGIGADHAAPKRPRGRGRPRDPDVGEQVIDAAIGLISESGFDGLTMDEVARRAGVAKATVYRRFPSKVDLVVAACNAVVPYAPAFEGSGSLEADLVELVVTIARRLSANEGGRLMPAMVAAAASNDEVREALRRFAVSRRSRLHDVLERAVTAGELRKDTDVDLLVDSLVGPVIYRHLVVGRPFEVGTARELVGQLLRGVRA